MFLSPNRPFFSSTQQMSLGAIPKKEYYDFAARHLDKINKKLTEGDFDYLYDKFQGHTWYIQTILNKLYANRIAPNSGNINEMIRLTIDENAY